MIRNATGQRTLSLGDAVYATSRAVLQGASYDEPSDVSARWELTDPEGDVILSGSPLTATASIIANGVAVVLEANYTLPTDLAMFDEGNYVMTWYVNVSGYQAQPSEELEITFEALATGLNSAVGIYPEPLVFTGVLEGAPIANMKAELYTPAGALVQVVDVVPTRAGDVSQFRAPFTSDKLWLMDDGSIQRLVANPTFLTPISYIDPDDQITYGYVPDRSMHLILAPGLDPWMAVYRDGAGAAIGTAQGWIINTIMANAMHELQATLERSLRYPGLLQSSLDNADYLRFMQMGRDRFNAVEKPSNLTMVRASGATRRMWLVCAAYEAAQSRQLEEAVKAFDFSGQSTTLTVDISQAYDSFKSDMAAVIDSDVRPYKRQLSLRGGLEGDGSASPTHGSVAVTSGSTLSMVGNGAYHGGYRDGFFGGYLQVYSGGKV